MPFNPVIHHRHTIRLPEYDYSSAGSYFVTICSLGWKCLFGAVDERGMQVNKFGEIVHRTWEDLVNHVPGLTLKDFVAMPNHVHGVVALAGGGVALGEVVRQFKTFSSKRINAAGRRPGGSVWQRSYYEHIVRDEADYSRIAEYIANNPGQWLEDPFHPTLLGQASGGKRR